MRLKKQISLLLMLIMTLALFPTIIVAVPNEPQKVFTVTLDPGEGNGQPIVFRYDEQSVIKEYKGADNCQFFQYGKNSIGFRLETNYCPASFSGPGEQSYFAGWSGLKSRTVKNKLDEIIKGGDKNKTNYNNTTMYGVSLMKMLLASNIM